MIQKLILVITILLYLGAAYTWFQEGWYRFFLVLLVSHLTALFDPLWQRLYAYSYEPPVTEVLTIFDRPLPVFILIGAAWFYSFPALVLFYFYRRRWWPRHYITGVIAFMSMLLYHLIGQGLALRSEIWSFDQVGMLPLDLPYPLFTAALAALVSLLNLYLLIATRHYALPALIRDLVGGLVSAPILVYGILGAPFWLPQMLEQPSWVVGLGLVMTVGLVIWVIHLTCWGLHASRYHRVRWS
ncbi:MAG: hypothetical protein KatS3mg057_0432 [Herpetosiphonaceae bacterium]|nr:MAG: hypothetical protein KatS3mg057_0432 [Herpetosiphonaceae bacterium]